MYKLVRTSRLYEQIVQQIEESIVKGDLKPGDQLPAERELAQRFGVSRTAVREAVKALREKGLVEAYSGRGTFITDGTSAGRAPIPRSDDQDRPAGRLTHLAEVRAILEPEIAALAATRIQEPELATMREAVAVMDRAGEDPDAYIEADLDFHLALAEGAANPLILSLLDSIVGLIARTAAANFPSARRSGARADSSQANPRSRGAPRCGESPRGDASTPEPGALTTAKSPRRKRMPGASTAHYEMLRSRSRRQSGMAKLGFIGLGVMGGHMVNRLLGKGHTVTGYNRTRAKAQWLMEKGMQWADSPRAVAERFRLCLRHGDQRRRDRSRSPKAPTDCWLG